MFSVVHENMMIILIIILIIIIMVDWDAGVFRHTENAMLCFTSVQVVLGFVCNFPGLKVFFFIFRQELVTGEKVRLTVVTL